MVRAPAVLTSRRAVALVALLTALAAWDALTVSLPGFPGGWDVVLVAGVLFPATFLVAWLMLPLAGSRRLLEVALATGALAVVVELAGLDGVFNVVKLVAFTLLGFWFVEMLEALAWVVVVAAVIPWLDAASVYHGPTRVVVEEQPGLFERIAVTFAIPGEDAAARLGPPDVIFFALFLAASSRYGLRVAATWVGMTAALSATLVATYALGLDDLPALPAISLGVRLPNADRLWHMLRGRGRGERRAP